MSNNKEVVIRDEVEVTVHGGPVSPMAQMQSMLAAGVKPEDLRELLALQKDYEANEAKKAYFEAVAAFKMNPPKVTKDKTVDYTSPKGRTLYNHASFGNVVETISASLALHGLSISFNQQQGQNGVLTVTCIMTHRLGFSQQTSLSSAPDSSGGKNSIQAIGSANSYLQRYTALAITGLATHDMDDDGIASEAQCIDGKQVSQIISMLDSKNVVHGPFFEFLGVECAEEIPLNRFNEVIRILEQTEVQA